MLLLWRLLTTNKFIQRQWRNQYFCPYCIKNIDFLEHLFVECPSVKEIQELVATTFWMQSLWMTSWSRELIKLMSCITSHNKRKIDRACVGYENGRRVGKREQNFGAIPFLMLFCSLKHWTNIIWMSEWWTRGVLS
jgi:hypothetical protein